MTAVRLPDGTNIDSRLTVGGMPPTATVGSPTIQSGSTYTAGTITLSAATASATLIFPPINNVAPAYVQPPHVLVCNQTLASRPQVVSVGVLAGGTASLQITAASGGDVISYLMLDRPGD